MLPGAPGGRGGLFPPLKGGGPIEGWTRKAALAGITWFPLSEGSGLGVTVGDGEHGHGVQQTGVCEHPPRSRPSQARAGVQQLCPTITGAQQMRQGFVEHTRIGNRQAVDQRLQSLHNPASGPAGWDGMGVTATRVAHS